MTRDLKSHGFLKGQRFDLRLGDHRGGPRILGQSVTREVRREETFLAGVKRHIKN
jgi:hypothetical protein